MLFRHLRIKKSFIKGFSILTKVQDRKLHGNGVLETELLQQPKTLYNKYSKAGKYAVCLTVKNTKGSNAETMLGYVAVKISEHIKTNMLN